MGIKLNAVETDGQSYEAVKFLGILPELTPDSEFNLYVRWTATTVKVDRSDTDATIVVAPLKRGKQMAWHELMQKLANHYGMTVEVVCDKGVWNAQTPKMVGVWHPAIEAPVIEQPAPVEAPKAKPVKIVHYVKPGTISAECCEPITGYDASTDPAKVTCEGCLIAMGDAEQSATGEFADPTNTPVIAGYYWKRYVLPGDLVTALSTYQLVQDGTSVQVAATVRYVKSGMWQATGCVWMSTVLTPGTYWDGESQADAFAHVMQYMAFVASVRGSGLTAQEINRLDWRTPYVAPKTVAVSWADVESAHKGHTVNYGLGYTFCHTCGCHLGTKDSPIGESIDIAALMVKPMSIATADILMPVRTPKISKPIMAKLSKRARKQGKRHAFAGNR